VGWGSSLFNLNGEYIVKISENNVQIRAIALIDNSEKIMAVFLNVMMIYIICNLIKLI